jgi:hypothetical protein
MWKTSGNLKRVMILILLLSIQGTWCTPGLNPDGSLNKETISKFYLDGDFETVITALEHYRKQNPDMSKDDQIFIYKHLSVIYASNPETKDKGESYMYQLLKLVPTIDLIDMYISDNIESIFLRVKERYQRMESQRGASKPSASEKPEAQASSPTPAPQQKPTAQPADKKSKKGKKWIWWTAGGVALAGAVTFFLVSSSDDTGTTTTISNYE